MARHARFALLAGGALSAAACAATPSATPPSAEPCGRECLIGAVESYLDAMVARDPSLAPLAEDVAFTENTEALAVGQGEWERVAGVRDYKVYAVDPDAGQVALYTVVDEPDRPALFTLRVKIENRLITEVETVRVGIGQTGFGSVDDLVTAASTWNETLPPERRRSREEMIAITDRYFETLEHQYVDYIPFTDDCLRVENGVVTAGQEGGEGIGAMNCRENLNQPIWAYITEVNPRRYLVVDEEKGLVSGMFMFRHGGLYDTYTNADGEVVPMPDAMMVQQAVIISELFKIDDGRISRIEAVMTGGLDLDADDGWPG